MTAHNFNCNPTYSEFSYHICLSTFFLLNDGYLCLEQNFSTHPAHPVLVIQSVLFCEKIHLAYLCFFHDSVSVE